MSNFVNTSNLSGPTLERALAKELESRLASVPWLRGYKVQPAPESSDIGFDILATLPLPKGGKVKLCVVCKREMRPRTFRMIAERQMKPPGRPENIIPVLAMPWVSPGIAEICQANKWSWFDLAGNHYLDVPGLLRISHTGNAPVHARPKPSANLGTAEAARVLRALLMGSPIGKTWTQHALQEVCRPPVSIGLVNKLVRHLREEDLLVAGEDGGVRIRDPLKLLSAWGEAYRFDRHARYGYFTLKQGPDLRSALSNLAQVIGPSAAYAAFSAAEIQAPHVRQPKTWLYLHHSYLADFERILDAKPVDSGENLVVLIPEDQGVFAGMDAQRGATHPVQTYVDLLHAGGRGQEAAEALLEQRIKPEWAKQGFKP